MKKRIALVSYADSTVIQYDLTFRQRGTESLSEEGVKTEIKDIDAGDGTGVEVKIGTSRITLTARETEALLTTLLAHQRVVEGFNVELYKKD